MYLSRLGAIAFLAAGLSTLSALAETQNIQFENGPTPLSDSIHACAGTFHLYRSTIEANQLHVRKEWETRSVEAESAFTELGLDGASDHRQIIAFQNAMRIAPILDHGLFWDAISDLLKERGFKTKQQVGIFIDSVLAGELSGDELDRLIENILIRLPDSLPQPTIDQLLKVNLTQQIFGISKRQYSALIEFINSKSPENRAKLKDGILGAMIYQDRQFIEKVMNSRNPIRVLYRKWLKFRLDRTHQPAFPLSTSESATALRNRLLRENAPGPEPLTPKEGLDPELDRIMTVSGGEIYLVKTARQYFRLNSTISEDDFYLLVDRLPTNVAWGYRNSLSMLDLALPTKWAAYFSPMDREVLYLALVRVRKIRNAERFKKSLALLLEKVRTSYGFQNGKTELQNELLEAFVNAHGEALKKYSAD